VVQWVDRCRWCCVLVSVVAVRWCNSFIGAAGAVDWKVLLLLCDGAIVL
jgi:hypothetical protein